MPRFARPPIFAIALITFVAGETVRADDFPPVPDFKRRFDYARWFERAQPSARGDRNAYPAYAAFMPGLIDSSIDPASWPTFKGMLTTPAHERPNQSVGRDGKPEWPPGPGPWLPQYHASWQASYLATKNTLAKFQDATAKPKLVPPIPLDGNAEDRNNRLVNLQFPHIKPLDDCAKGVLENAWRIGDDGEVDPRALGQAVKANLHLAAQMKGCISYPEFSATCSIRSMTYDHIFWGFAHGVFNEKNANKLFKILQDIDDDKIEAKPVALGECAIWLDAIQHIYSPFDGGNPKFNGNRFRDITGQSMGGGGIGSGIGARVDQSPAHDIANEILAKHRAMQRQMRAGYETGSHGSLIALADQLRNAHGVTKAMFLTGRHVLASAYSAAAQTEAKRRAAHLIAALHAYKKARQEWPSQLSDLGKRVPNTTMRDPYGNDDFVYRVTDSGPVLYSIGGNGKDDGGVHEQGSGDLVFWPIPKSAGWIAAGQLIQVKEANLTNLGDVTSSLDGKTVIIEGKITSTENQISPEHDRILRISLERDGAEATAFYYKAIADQLRPDQTPKRGTTIRLRGTVVKEGDGFKVHLVDAMEMVVLSQ